MGILRCSDDWRVMGSHGYTKSGSPEMVHGLACGSANLIAMAYANGAGMQIDATATTCAAMTRIISDSRGGKRLCLCDPAFAYMVLPIYQSLG